MGKEKYSLIPACSEFDLPDKGHAFTRNTLPLPSEGSYLNLLKIKWVIKFVLYNLQKSIENGMRTISNIIGLLYS